MKINKFLKTKRVFTIERISSDQAEAIMANVNQKLFLRADMAVCVGCGCDDLHACVSDDGDACYWEKVNYETKQGVCSECAWIFDADIDQQPIQIEDGKTYLIQLANCWSQNFTYFTIRNKVIIEDAGPVLESLWEGKTILNEEFRIGAQLKFYIDDKEHLIKDPIISFKEVKNEKE